jgi:pimeloyl-ACP methyl ester carboxylesterase
MATILAHKKTSPALMTKLIFVGFPLLLSVQPFFTVDAQMQKIISKDGTPIAYQRSGAGPPLVLIHGTSASHVRWAPVLPALEQHFSTYAVDRRGRGESGDRDPYAVEREFEDIAAVADSIGEPVNLLGHSYGGWCALEAALLTRNLRKLVLYEPVGISLPGVSMYPEGILDRIQALLDAGDREAVLTTFFREVVRMPPHEFERYRSLPAWQARLAAAHTLPREMRAEERYEFKAARFGNLHTPTLLLLGGDSPEFLKAGAEMLHAALPNSFVVVMPGQQHIAMDTAPELFVREVLVFLNEAS